MKQRYSTWASTVVIIATMLGCGDDSSGAGNPITGAAGATAGIAAPAAGGTGAAAGASAGTAAPPATGAAGARPAGSGATGTAGASGSGTATAGTPAMATAGAGDVGAAGMGAGGMSAGGAPAAGGADAPVAGMDGAAGGGAATPGVVTNCGSADNVDQTKGPGPFTPTIIMNGGAGTSWVYYPMELGRDGCKHPIFNWGPGAGTGPSNYRDHLNHLASHGFVIISQPSSGNGTTEKASLEWLIKQNDTMGSPFYQKLDTKKVVMGGHSMGAITTFAMADFEPLTHYILVCGGSFGAPTGADKIHGPTIILGGDADNPGTPNFEDDYEAIPTPVIFLIKSGTDHVACARNNLEPWTAFMRWQLYGEEKWKKDFFMGGKYCNAPWDSCESKGW